MREWICSDELDWARRDNRVSAQPLPGFGILRSFLESRNKGERAGRLFTAIANGSFGLAVLRHS